MDNPHPERSSRFRGKWLQETEVNRIWLAVARFFAELIGTGIFIFVGCMGSVKGMGYDKNCTSNAFAFAIAALIGTQIFFRCSGGHLNPSLTCISLFFSHISYPEAVLYVMAQCIGGVLGYGLITLLTPHENMDAEAYEGYGLCTTYPNPDLSLITVIATEFAMSIILGLVVCSLWDVRNVNNNIANVKYGLSYFTLIYAAGAYTGCSMNPARSLAPAVWNNSWKDHWVYWVTPLIAAICAGFFYTTFNGASCYMRREKLPQAIPGISAQP